MGPFPIRTALSSSELSDAPHAAREPASARSPLRPGTPGLSGSKAAGRPGPRGGAPAAFLSGIGWVTLIAGAASVPLERTWPFELVTHFWPQVALILVASGLLCLATGRRVGAILHIVGALGLGGVLLTVPTWEAVPAGEAARPVTGGELAGLYANVGRWNREYGRLLALIDREAPEVIGLAEIDDSWVESLAPLSERYPHRLLVPRSDFFGIGLLSRFPLADTSSAPIGDTGIPSIVATVEAPGGSWRVFVGHPAVPTHPAAFRARNALIGRLPDVLPEEGPPAIVLADLNASVWSPYVRDLARHGIRPAYSGPRSLYTWPTFFPPLGIALDHCLVSRGAVPLAFEVLPAIGSDHFPIACRVGRGVPGPDSAPAGGGDGG